MKYNKPVIIAGNGIRTSGAIDTFRKFINTYKIPFVTSFLAKDILPGYPLNFGVMGIKGNYWANKITKEADLIICLGTRLARGMIGYSGELLNPSAYKIVVDIDKVEHSKDTIKIDEFIEMDLSAFPKCLCQSSEYVINIFVENNYSKWIKQCNEWKEEYKINSQEFNNGIDVYKFFDELSNYFQKDSVIVTDAGTCYFVAPQALKLKEGMRYITDGAQAAMGFALPASIGCYFADNTKPIICIVGDGSFQFNMQELATIMHHKIPIKIFVINNNGYMTIRNTADKFFEGRCIGTDSSCGISFPNLDSIANAYQIDYEYVKDDYFLEDNIKMCLESDKAMIMEIICCPVQKLLASY